MAVSSEQKTVQACILAYAEEIGWCYVPCTDVKSQEAV